MSTPQKLNGGELTLQVGLDDDFQLDLYEEDGATPCPVNSGDNIRLIIGVLNESLIKVSIDNDANAAGSLTTITNAGSSTVPATISVFIGKGDSALLTAGQVYDGILLHVTLTRAKQIGERFKVKAIGTFTSDIGLP